MTKMTKTQQRFRLNRMKKDVAFLYVNQPLTGGLTAKDVEAIDKIVTKCLKKV
jgi:hypothetical protein